MTWWNMSIRVFDASVGGLGGCPFAPGASGNVATEAVVAALAGKGVTVGVDPAKLRHARDILKPFLRTERRARPKDESQACSVCEHFTGDVCCGREALSG